MKVITSLLISGVVLLGGVACARQVTGRAIENRAEAATEPGDESPTADQVLRRMADHLASTKAFHLRAEVTFDDVPRRHTKVQYSGTIDVYLRRPDRLFVNYRDDLSAKQLWIDGNDVTLFDPMHNVYFTTEAASTIGATLERLSAEYGFSLPLDDLLVPDPHPELASGVVVSRYLGLHQAGGMSCHHVVFAQDDVTWQIWVDAGDKPLLRKKVITYKTLPMAPQFTIELERWDGSPVLPDSRFQPDIPDDAIRIDFAAIEETDS